MSEIKVGEYVRTSIGIIYKLTKKKQEEIENYPKFLQYIEQKSIVKHSFNIIDLIEEGDYVNGYKVDEIRNNYYIYCEKQHHLRRGLRLAIEYRL